MVAYTFYQYDGRVRRYAEALAKHGYRVDVISLRWNVEEPEEEIIRGVHVFRIQGRVINEKGKLVYLRRLLQFFFHSMLFLMREQRKERYSVVHVHSVPDFEVFAAWYPKLTGSKILLDIHDIVPELYASKFNASNKSLAFRLLVVIERMATSFSHHVIAANHLWEKRLEQRSVKSSKLTTILNYPEASVFKRRGRNRDDRKFIALYPGTLSYHQGVDLAVRAFSLLKDKVPNVEFHIYGAGDQLVPLKSLIVELGLQTKVFLKEPLPPDQIIPAIENADLGIVPKRNEGFADEAFSTKILEFMILGVPVIVPNTTIDRYYFNDSVAKFFCANDERSLADAILLLIEQPELRQALIRNADEFVKGYTWEANEAVYLNLVDSLVNRRRRPNDQE
jgi:glycosyltransferase involved in cell wall biosynthesis